MHHDDSSALALTTSLADCAIEQAVLAHLIVVHPTRLTWDELIRELATDYEQFSERDPIERAIRALVGVGLLRNECKVVVPTRAALYFRQLEG